MRKRKWNWWLYMHVYKSIPWHFSVILWNQQGMRWSTPNNFQADFDVGKPWQAWRQTSIAMGHHFVHPLPFPVFSQSFLSSSWQCIHHLLFWVSCELLVVSVTIFWNDIGEYSLIILKRVVLMHHWIPAHSPPSSWQNRLQELVSPMFTSDPLLITPNWAYTHTKNKKEKENARECIWVRIHLKNIG